MKKFSTDFLLPLVLSVSILLSGCYGSFNLVREVYDWNGTIEDKTVRSVVFWALVIIPVYEVAGLVDAVVLNVIEFWSGDNPLSMKEGESDMRMVEHKGRRYKVEARKNRFTVWEEGRRKPVRLVFTPVNATWNLEQGGELIALSRFEEGLDGRIALRVFHSDGQSALVDCTQSMNWISFSSALQHSESVASR
ncbi:MAG: DUF3332 domain-containing protein [Bacteroidota bacterium]